MKPPNILVICSDQHHPRYAGFRGHPYLQTPNLDQLAAQGTHFDRAYCNSPVCTPSRMSFITGKYVYEIGSWFIGVPLEPQEMTWARRLDQAGIPCTMLGKMDFCGDYQDGGFTDYKIIEKRPAFDPYPLQEPFLARIRGYTRPDKRIHIQKSGIRQPIVTDGADGHSSHLGFFDHDRRVTEWALEYLDRKVHDPDDRPWALYLGYLFPHWPYLVPQPYFDRYYPDRVQMPFDAHFPINPNLHPALQEFQQMLDLGEVTEEDVRRTLAAYCGMITCLDEMIGRVLGRLKETGQYENTYIIYTSDHGESAGEHGLFYKQCSYEGSVGVPLIVSGPGLARGAVCSEPVSLLDLYPTVLEMADLPVEDDRQGQSWLPLCRNETPVGQRKVVFAEYHGNFFRQDWYMLVRGNYKYTAYLGERPTLFNLKEDPQELRDLAPLPDYAGLLDDFDRQLRSQVDPERVALRSKQDLGLIGPAGQDYTKTATIMDFKD